MSDAARQRYLTTHIGIIANEVRAGLQAIPENFEGIQAITSALDSFEHEALLDPRGTDTADAFRQLKNLCTRFRANVYPEMLEAGFRAIQNTPIKEDARERDRLNQQYVDAQRAYYAQLAGQQAVSSYNVNNLANLLGAQDSGAAYQQRMARDAYAQVASWGRPRNDEAEKRGMDLLRDNLSETQRNELEQHGWFHVIGNSSKKTYRIRPARQLNIDELDKNGRNAALWCFLPTGGVVLGDCMLAQKIALETDEKAALKVANKFRAAYDYSGALESNSDRINRLYGNQGVTVDYGAEVNEESRSWIRQVLGF